MIEKSKVNKARVKDKPYLGDNDFWRIRNMISETKPITPVGFNWEVRRWDGWRFYNSSPDWDSRRNKTVRLWETDKGKLVGAVHPEGSGNAHIQIHPDYRYIEDKIIIWAEQNLAMSVKNSRPQLRFFIHENDSYRRNLLKRRGYIKTGGGEVTRRLCFKNNPVPQPEMANGYSMRSTRPDDIDDCQQIADLLNAAFNRNFHVAEEFHFFAKYAPCYQNDLNLVAVAPDGTFAAYVGAPYDEINKCGIFEPVCTHPAHQRKGLARSLMLEALHRLKNIGASEVLVGTGEGMAANRLYESIGFAQVYKSSQWKRIIYVPSADEIFHLA